MSPYLKRLVYRMTAAVITGLGVDLQIEYHKSDSFGVTLLTSVVLALGLLMMMDYDKDKYDG